MQSSTFDYIDTFRTDSPACGKSEEQVSHRPDDDSKTDSDGLNNGDAQCVTYNKEYER